jgi:putative transposase
MPRGPRLDAEGALHHVMVRGIEKRKIFLSRMDREDLLRRFSLILPKAGARLYAWSLLPNHFHLLLRTGSVGLSSVMRRILTGYATSFNRRHRRSGHLFQNRYKSILVEEEAYLLELVRYIHLNPLRARLVEDVEGLSFYPWSGHAVLLGRRDYPWQDCSYVLSQMGKKRKRAREAYGKFVEDGISGGRRPELVGGGLVRSMGGWEKVKELRRGRESWAHDERVLGSSDFVESVMKEIDGQREKKGFRGSKGPDVLLRLAEELGSKLNLSRAQLTGGGRQRRVVEGRNLVSYVGVHGYGMTPTQVGRGLNVSVQSVIRGVNSGAEGFRKRGWRVQDFIK